MTPADLRHALNLAPEWQVIWTGTHRQPPGNSLL